MSAFASWFMDKIRHINYYMTSDTIVTDTCDWFTFADFPETERFHVCYVKVPLSPETIRISFSSHENEPILFVVDAILLRSIDATNVPMWLKALHAIYYGRIYVWMGDSDNSVSAIHFDWSKHEVSYAHNIEIDGILFTDTDCKLRDFPGIFHIARFYDKAFWKEQEPQKPPNKRKKPRSNANENFWKEEWVRQNNTPPKQEYEIPEDIREAFKRYYEEAMRQRQAQQQHTYNQTPNRYAPTGDKWLQQFVATGSLEAAKTMYRQLSKQYHPDLNPGDTVAEDTFKAISVAFAKVRDILK